MRLTLIPIYLILLSMTAQADSLKDFNKALSDLNQSLNKPAQTARPQTPPARTATNMAPITTEQQDKIKQALAKRTTDARVKGMISEASPTVQAFVERLSCIVGGGGGESLNLYAAPGKSFHGLAAPMVFTRYHDKGTCLTVARIHGWSAPALNALNFEVVYLAEDSGESIKTNHQMVKQPDGIWLFTK